MKVAIPWGIAAWAVQADMAFKSEKIGLSIERGEICAI
jgi:hypothetical protein